MPFAFEPLALPEVILVKPRIFPDDRGFFLETHKESEFRPAGITGPFVQDNHSRSTRGVLRGLHYQLPPRAQGKLVGVVTGAIWDVAVDLRRASPTFGRWVAAELTEENGHRLWVPPGFGHGFVTLSDVADVYYKCTDEYAPDLEKGVRWDDPDLAVAWPLTDVQVSARDEQLPMLGGAEIFD